MSEENKVQAGDLESSENNPDKNLNTDQTAQPEQPQEETVSPTEEQNKAQEETSPKEEVNPVSAVEATETETTDLPITEAEGADQESEEPSNEDASEAVAETATSETEEVVSENTTETTSSDEAVSEASAEGETDLVERSEPETAEAPDVAAETTTETPVEGAAGETNVSESSEVAESGTDTEDESAEEEEKEEEEPIIDYSNHSREELAQVVEELSKRDDNFKRADAILSQVLPLFKAVEKTSRLEAKERFLADGGEEDDFEFRHDDIFNRFDASVRLIRDKRNNYYKERESRKENNYQHKLEVLDKLRELIDGEKATTNLAPIKELQEEWKSIGPVPAQHNRTLWANYNALLDRFYNNRHILFELKELDRKKNLVKKQELCEKAEALNQLENIKDAIAQLNELHEEYKKIGPVPRESQEELWTRFKAASDIIYEKRRAYMDSLRGELQENLHKKRALAEELKPFLTFDSDRINEWNSKTKEILAIQKRWDALGGLPREHAKEVNKAFWSAFKGFFSNKNNFFKKLEGLRHENLKKKEELVVKAEELKDSTDWDKTTNAMKDLQRQWKEIGPVPENFRNSVYAKFKEACDAFFNNRRSNQNKAEQQYVENLQHKEDLIKEINDRVEEGKGEAGDLDDLMTRWGAIGYVPRNSIKSIEAKFRKAIDAFVASLDIDENERQALVMKAELNTLKKGPDASRKLNKKEFTLRKQINELEDNIALWNNNLAFFANSKTADKLKAEFDEKIEKAEEEIQQLKKQLKLIRSM